jgi:hypothetical protein
MDVNSFIHQKVCIIIPKKVVPSLNFVAFLSIEKGLIYSYIFLKNIVSFLSNFLLKKTTSEDPTSLNQITCQ